MEDSKLGVIQGKDVGGNGWREANIWGTASVRIKWVTLLNPNITGWHYLCFLSSSLRDPGWWKLSLSFHDIARVQILVYTCWIFPWPKQLTWSHLNLKGWGYAILLWTWRTRNILWLELMTTTESGYNLWGCEPWGGWSFRFNKIKL